MMHGTMILKKNWCRVL